MSHFYYSKCKQKILSLIYIKLERETDHLSDLIFDLSIKYLFILNKTTSLTMPFLFNNEFK